jgi:ATP synthase protein I
MRNIHRFLIVQLIVIGLATIITLLIYGLHEALSAWLGGMVAFIPFIIFAKKAFQYQGARAAKKIVKNFYIGEFLKIISSILLFILVFWWYKVAALVFFLTYIAVIVTHWFAPLFINNEQNGLKSD